MSILADTAMIEYFVEPPLEFQIFGNELLTTWLTAVVQQEGCILQNINYIFCTDDYLLKINQEYLQHNYYTDIITFDNSEEQNHIEGDIFVSIDRVKDNAQEYNIVFEEEFRRVVVHGILHLIGFKDKTDEEQLEMRQKEAEYLAKYQELTP